MKESFTKKELAILRHWRKSRVSSYFSSCEFHNLDDEKVRFMEKQIDAIIKDGYWTRTSGKTEKRPQELEDLLEDVGRDTHLRVYFTVS
jgi:tRNA G10  N-methylase Trm11